MKIKVILTLAAVCAAFALGLSPELSAQTISTRRVVSSSAGGNSAAATEARGNLVLCLNIVPKNKEAEGQESIRVLLVAGETSFKLNPIRMQGDFPVIMSFYGNLIPVDGETFSFGYTLSQALPIMSNNTLQYRDSGWTASIELKKNEKVVLMEDSTASYELSLSDAPPPKPVADAKP
jgi:hypothetical protein